MRLFRSALLMLALLFPLTGFCCDYTYIGSPYTVDYGNIIVQRDVPVGQAISNEIYGSLAHAYTCVTTGNEGSSSGIKALFYPMSRRTARGAFIKPMCLGWVFLLAFT